MAEFVYNNFKNASTSYTPFELNCSYHPCISFKDKYNAQSRSSSAKKPVVILTELMNICCQNFLHAQDLPKQAYDKGVKLRSYTSGEKVWFNSKKSR